MAALTDHTQISTNPHAIHLTPLGVKAATAVWTGSLTCTEDANGLAVPLTDAAGLTYQGIAMRGYDNSGGAAGAIDGVAGVRFCEVDRGGIHSKAVTGTAPKAGQTVHGVDDDTVTVDATTNNIVVGKAIQPDPADPTGRWMIAIDSATP